MIVTRLGAGAKNDPVIVSSELGVWEIKILVIGKRDRGAVLLNEIQRLWQQVGRQVHGALAALLPSLSLRHTCTYVHACCVAAFLLQWPDVQIWNAQHEGWTGGGHWSVLVDVGLRVFVGHGAWIMACLACRPGIINEKREMEIVKRNKKNNKFNRQEGPGLRENIERSTLI